MWPFSKRSDKSVKSAQKRRYEAAKTNRLTASWQTSILSPDAILRMDLPKLRSRSRDLEMNNDYALKFISMALTNVLGQNGIQSQAKFRDSLGNYDRETNKLIEKHFKAWSKKENASVCGRYSWKMIQQLALRSVIRDGEVLVRRVKNFQNKYKYSLQLIESDHLDFDFNGTTASGNRVSMGVEFDAWNKPVAYYILSAHPGDRYAAKITRTRIDASEIIHLFVPTRINQTRGVPWAHAAMTRLQNLGGYEESEMVAARVAAAKMGFFTQNGTSEQYEGDERDDEGNIITDAEPGTFELLPQGVGFTTFDPEHPVSAFDQFLRRSLMGISSGLNVSYNSLANDRADVNFSSIRSGLLEERDAWRMVQGWFAEYFIAVVTEEWFDMTMMSGVIKSNKPIYASDAEFTYNARGWDWVDPLKDVKANIEAINAGLKTRAEVISNSGGDFEDTIEQLSAEEELIEEYGLNLTTNTSTQEEEVVEVNDQGQS